MSATTEDQAERRSKVDAMLEDVPFARMDPPPSELAPETPLTREAVIHLRAAAAEVSRAYGDVHALLDTVERALSEPAGGEKVFSEEERMNLGRLVRQAQQKADHEMQRPVFERGRGERPHGDLQENGDTSPAGDVSVARLFDVLNVAKGCLGLAADGELENSYGVSPRTMFRQVYEHLRPVHRETREALGRDEDRELTIANNTLEALAGSEEGES